MTREFADLSSVEQLALQAMTCGYCGARPGHWCVTVKSISRPVGARAAFLHQARMWQLQSAWFVGHGHGYRSALEFVQQALEAARLGHVWAANAGIPALDDDRLERWLRGKIDARP